MNLKHDDMEQLLPWYVKKSLSDGEMLMVSEHLEDCKTCQMEVDSLSEFSKVVVALGDDEVATSNREEILNRAIQRAANESSDSAGSFFWNLLQRYFFPPVAALAVLLLVFQNFNVAPQPQGATAGSYQVFRLAGQARANVPNYKRHQNQALLFELENPDVNASWSTYRCELRLEGEKKALYVIPLAEAAVFQLQFPSTVAAGSYLLEIYGEIPSEEASIATFAFTLD